MSSIEPQRTGDPLSRRRLLGLSLTAAGAGLGLSACGNAAALVDPGRRVRQWNLFGGGDGARLIQMHEKFQAEHPEIDFTATTLQWGPPFYTKTAMAAAGGRSPDVATMHLSRLPGFAPGRLLDPIPRDLLDEFGITEDKFLPKVWERTVFDGEVYAIPLDTHPFVTYYNTEICEKAGVLDSDGNLPQTEGTEELLEMLRAVKGASGQWAVAIDTAVPWRLWFTLYRQLGGEIIRDGALVLDDDKGVEALAFMKRLADEGLTPKDSVYDALVANFANGAAGLAWNGEWEVTTYQDADLPFDMTPFPNVYGNRRTYGDSHSFVLPHQRSRDEQTLRDTLTYVSWMLKNSVDWAKGGHIPAYQPVATSQAYLDLEPQSHYREVDEDVQFHPTAWFSGSGAQIETEAAAAFTGIYSGRDPAASLAQFRGALQKLLAIPAPV